MDVKKIGKYIDSLFLFWKLYDFALNAENYFNYFKNKIFRVKVLQFAWL